MNRNYRLKVSLSKRFEVTSSRTSFIDKEGNPLSRENTKTTVRLLECWYRMCFDVLSSVTSSSHAYDVCCSWLSKQPPVLDVAAWISALETMADQFIHGRTLNLKGATPLEAWLKVFFRSKSIKFIAQRRDVYSLLKFPKRLTLVNVEEIKVATEKSFFENANRVAGFIADDAFTSEEKLILHSWLFDYEQPTIWDCHHSSGSTADPDVRNNIAEKYAATIEDPYTWEWCVLNHIPTLWLHSGEFTSTIVLNALKAGHRLLPDYRDYVPSRLQFVPKSYKTYRSIAMESETRMFYQNGMKNKLVELIQRRLKRHIDLEDQERSRQLALEASKSKAFATIDFSMASDSVSLALFSKWFGGTRFGRDALLLRARSFTYDGNEYDNPIAFTMGSPLCFPVECLVFLAMAYATIEECGGDPEQETILVYGDDVIIPSQYAEAYMRRARRNGFLPNWDKSYWQDDVDFREACGMEALSGEDITPLYVPRKFSGNLCRSRSSYIHLANAAFGRGYFGMRKKILHWLTTDKVVALERNRRRRNRHGRHLRTVKSWVVYSDDLHVLLDESSTLVYDPEADRLNLPRIRFQRAPYKYGTHVIRKCIECLDVVTLPDKKGTMSGWPKEAIEKAKLSFCLHYKPKDVSKDRYAARDAVAQLLASGKFIYLPKVHRGFEHTITRMALTIRPYDSVE